MHRFDLQVYYEDTDAGGVVYYANYLKFAERARTNWLHQLGFSNRGLMDSHQIMLAVRRCEVDFLAPARLEDELEILSEIQSIGGASFTFLQTIERQGQALVRLQVKLAVVHTTGGPARLPPEFRQALQALA